MGFCTLRHMVIDHKKKKKKKKNLRPPSSTPTAHSPTSRPCPCLHPCIHPTISSPLAQLSEPLSTILWLAHNGMLPLHDCHSCRPGGVCAHHIDSGTHCTHRHQYPILALFECHIQENVLSHTVHKHIPLNCYGHSYAIRKRKESADHSLVHVWIKRKLVILSKM